MAGEDGCDQTDRWSFPGDPKVGVGSRHHIVSRFYLKRWANADGQIDVVEKPGGKRCRVNIKDAATEKDFYTYIDLNGEPAGHLEQLLSHIEDQASSAIANIVHPTFGGFPPSPEEKHYIATLLAFQVARGRKTRRSIELQADLVTRLQLSAMDRSQVVERLRQEGEEPTDERIQEAVEFISNLDEYEFVPDPNDHLKMMGGLSFELYKRLMRRHWYLAEFDAPVLLTCDEPVVRYSSQSDPMESLGFLNAEEVWFPLGPEFLLILTRDVQSLPYRFRVPNESAATTNLMLMHNAYQYIFLRPDHAALPELPPDEPPFRVEAPGFPMVERYNKPPTVKRTQRRRTQK
ncbi:MAG TPA: DUF4238 domain-containing protein [Micromonosporaceae bacterium]|nr:DUF4238 domain-containing protein [Micromonosporaceae bacterium]